MKTNKSYTKRLKITKNGKILAKKAGKNHFNAKEDRQSQLGKKRWKPLEMKQKTRARFFRK